jgi:hypothetical protein
MDPYHWSERKPPLHLPVSNQMHSHHKPACDMNCYVVVTLMTSAVSHMLRIASLASSADDHNGSLKFGSYQTSAPASLAALAAAICAVLQGSVIRLIEP